MCSRADDPTTYDDPPTPQRPRKYELSGDGPRPSVALAVLGEMLTEAEDAWDKAPRARQEAAAARVGILRSARDRVAAAEAAL